MAYVDTHLTVCGILIVVTCIIVWRSDCNTRLISQYRDPGLGNFGHTLMPTLKTRCEITDCATGKTVSLFVTSVTEFFLFK